MKGDFDMKIAYVRVSSADQNEARQVEALKKYGIEKWFIEKVSGKDMNRPELRRLLEFAREGAILYMFKISVGLHVVQRICWSLLRDSKKRIYILYR